MNQTVNDNWSCSEAIAWYARSIHNAAIEAYMTEPDEKRFKEVAKELQKALDALRKFSVRGPVDGGNCPMGWCPDSKDRCVPCSEPEMRAKTASKGT